MSRNIYNEFTKWGLSRMKNRDRYILKRNEYDMLSAVQLALLHGERCVISALMAQDYSCPKYVNDNEDPYERCCQCIQEWLNEEN